MSLTRAIYWAGVTALLYLLFLAVFYTANVTTIYLIRGPGPLTPDVLTYLFMRDVVVCIPITIVSTVIFALMMRRRRERRR